MIESITESQGGSINKSEEIIKIIKSYTSSDEGEPNEHYTAKKKGNDSIKIIPEPEIPSKGLSDSQKLEISPEKINSQILEERQKEWTKM